jgi:hypothetical protein
VPESDVHPILSAHSQSMYTKIRLSLGEYRHASSAKLVHRIFAASYCGITLVGSPKSRFAQEAIRASEWPLIGGNQYEQHFGSLSEINATGRLRV